MNNAQIWNQYLIIFIKWSWCFHEICNIQSRHDYVNSLSEILIVFVNRLDNHNQIYTQKPSYGAQFSICILISLSTYFIENFQNIRRQNLSKANWVQTHVKYTCTICSNVKFACHDDHNMII